MSGDLGITPADPSQPAGFWGNPAASALLRCGRVVSVRSAVAGQVGHGAAGVNGGAGAVDDVLDGSGAAQRDGDQVVPLDSGRGRGGERVRADLTRVHVEEAVHAQAVGLEAGHAAGDGDGWIPVGGSVHPGGLAGRVVGHLALVEVVGSAVTVPLDLDGLVVLDRQPVHGDVGPVDDQAVGGGVGRPADRAAVTVVGPPEPQVVADHVAAVDLQRLGGLAGGGAADAGEDVGQDGRIGGVAGAGTGRADLDQDRTVGGARVKDEPADPDAVDGGGLQDRAAAVGHQRGQAEAEHHGV